MKEEKIKKLENEGMREWGIGYKKRASGEFVSLFNFAKVWNFGKVCAVKSDTLEDSEGNGDFQKKVKGVFDEKRV